MKGKSKISLTQGDITTLKVDAIVNAANWSLLGGAGVDGAIHKVAGPELLAECRTLGGCAAGQAKITKGYNLPAKYVIHTVGPVYGDENDEPEVLARCYANSLSLAKARGLKIIAFPCISTGYFGYPKELAAKTAIAAVQEFVAKYMHKLRYILQSLEKQWTKCYDEGGRFQILPI